MKRVYKYPFPILDDVRLALPVGARIIKVATAGVGAANLWAIVDPSIEAKSMLELRIVGTGHDFDDANLRHIDTIFDGPFVWHVFEVKK